MSTDSILLRRQLLEQVKNKVHLIDGSDDPELKKYFLPYKRDLHEQDWFPVQRSEFIADILKSDIIVGGDFHAFSQSQRTHLRVMRNLKKLQKSLVLALECFESRHQCHVDSYLSGDINEEKLVELCEWQDGWGFPFKNYLPLIKFAKQKGHKVLAINKKSELESDDSKKRDEHIAETIVSFCENNQDALIYVIVGDLHIASDHVPSEIKKINPQLKVLSIFQNSEKLYFDLLEQGLENRVDIMKSKSFQYCILTSPPWVKWQSYLMFLESNDDFHIDEFEIAFEEDSDDDDCDDFEDYDEDFFESADFTDQLYSIFDFLNSDLNLNITFDHAEVFTEFTDYLLNQFSTKLSSSEFHLVKEMVQNSKSFYLPNLGALYLSRFTINHASEVIGQYVQAEVSGRSVNLFHHPQDFKKLIWVETLSYFLSKIYNHKRKTMSFKSLKLELLTLNPEDSNHEVLKYSLGHAINEYFSAMNIKRSNLELSPMIKSFSYIESARILGQFKGEQLYLKYKQGLFTKEHIIQFLQKDVSAKDFEAYYNSVIKALLAKKSAKDKKEYIL